MVVAGKIRGDAPRLGRYLFTPGKNERITILHLDGREDVTPEEFKDFLYSVELNSELTRSDNSAYHAYINPNPEDTLDRVMTREEWFQSVDILTKQLNYEDQRHGVVLHDLGNGRVHAHIVYERYNHERGVMATYEHNYKAHDRAREQMEKELGHKRTPQKNINHDRHKQTLTAIWKRTNTSQEFIREAEANGYKIAKGTNRPFHVIDANGVSFDLVRKLDGIKTAEVRQRLGETALIDEKAAIREMQSVKKERQQAAQDNLEVCQQQPTIAPKTQEQALSAEPQKENGQDDDREELRRKFLEQIREMKARSRSITREITLYVLIALRVSFSFKGFPTKAIKPECRLVLVEQFTSHALNITEPERWPPEQEPPENAISFWRAANIYKPT